MLVEMRYSRSSHADHCVEAVKRFYQKMTPSENGHGFSDPGHEPRIRASVYKDVPFGSPEVVVGFGISVSIVRIVSQDSFSLVLAFRAEIPLFEISWLQLE